MLLLFSPVFLFNTISKFWLILFYCIVIIPVILNGAHIYFFNAQITYQAIASILVTSYSEAAEFLHSQLSFLSIVWIIFLIILPLVPIKKLWNYFPAPKTHYGAFITILCVCGIIFLVIGKHKFLKDSQVWITYSNFYQYYKNGKEFSQYLDKIKGVKLDEVYDKDKNINKTLVVLIGESSSKHHWGLYGYHRDTTPNLNKIQNNLFIFKNAVSPTAFTTTSLIKSLFFESIGGYPQFPVISVLQQAGYSVYWVSNQATAEMGVFNYLALMADETQYLNRSGTYDFKYKSYDENLIAALLEILNKKQNQKKVIFLHTIGSHAHYHSRYPMEFQKFNSYGDLIEKPWRTTESFETINSYDNSIYYTDYIIYSLIEKLKKAENSSLLYFSDHGEEVFDVLPFHGRTEDIPSRYMVDIPVLFWLSEDMKQVLKEQSSVWQTRLDKPFMTDILSFMICDILNINIPKTEQDSFNPLNPLYKPYNRIIEKMDYDKIFEGEKGLFEPVVK